MTIPFELNRVHCMDCLEGLRQLPDGCVDSVITDPPYGLSFMGKDWDHGVPGAAFWREALRIAKPGCMLLAFGGTRTFHRLTCAIEDAGWEIRDCIMWVYGSGFPKSHDISKAIDRELGVEREDALKGGHMGAAGRAHGLDSINDGGRKIEATIPAVIDKGRFTRGTPSSPEAVQWSGWGTALKPAWEPIIVARKPLEGTVAQNVLKYGTGGINVDGCRVGTEERTNKGMSSLGCMHDDAWQPRQVESVAKGRWPANLIHDGSEEVIELMPKTGASKGHAPIRKIDGGVFANRGKGGWPEWNGIPDSGGSAARFFYCAKASKADRDEGCEGLPLRYNPYTEAAPCAVRDDRTPIMRPNHHPTVKPTALMRYLCRLVTPPNGLVLDPFAGSGSTGKAAILEGFRFIGFELETEYVEIANARIAAAKPDRRQAGQLTLFEEEE